MNWLLDGLVAWGAVAPIAATLLTSKLSKPVYEKHAIVQPHPRGGAAPKLRFGFTLDGALVGEMVPEDQDPAAAAAARSQREGKTYGARRI